MDTHQLDFYVQPEKKLTNPIPPRCHVTADIIVTLMTMLFSHLTK